MTTLDLLKKLISIQSVFPHEERISLFLSDYLANIGFHITHIETTGQRKNIIATYGITKKYIGFYGHMDTVPPDPAYVRDPYTPLIKNDQLYGLGAADMKGGLTAMVKVAEYAVEKKLPVKIIFGVDEEGISKGAHDLVSSGNMGDIDFLISAESGQVQNIHQAYSLCLGRKGRILFEIKTKGKRTHAAEKHGINAIEQMAAFLQNLPSIRFASHKFLGSTRIVIHAIRGETDSFSIPDSCVATLSILTTPTETSETVQKKLVHLGKRMQIDLTVFPVIRETPYGESYEINQENTFFRVLKKQIFLTDNMTGSYADSVADENVFAKRLNIPVLALGPIGNGDHVANEWVSISSINTVIEAYKKILMLFNNH